MNSGFLGNSQRIWLIPAFIIALAAIIMAFSMARQAMPVPKPAASGTMIAVTLTSGPVFYGRLLESTAGQIRLTEVYYVETFTNADGRRENRVVNRRKNDWHAPEWMSIPREHIAMIEPLAPESRLGALIAQEKKTP